MALRKRAAEDSKVLAENIDQPPVDRARSGDDAVSRDLLLGHAEVDAIVLDIGIEFLELILVKQHVEPFARSQFAFGVLRIDALLTATQLGCIPTTFHFGDIGGHGF